MAKSKKNKSPGAQIVFDEDERKKYLLGFRKRKIQRREKAKEELEERIRQEKKKQRELKTQAIMDERKKAGLPVFGGDKLVLKTKNVIETDQNEIIISDFSSSLGTKQVKLDDEDEDDDFDKRDWENQSLLHKSVVADSEMMKSKAKLSKESTAISERLTKLEKQKKSLETSNTKKKKNYLKSKKTAKKSRAARKYLSKDAKIKLKNRINKAKKAK